MYNNFVESESKQENTFAQVFWSLLLSGKLYTTLPSTVPNAIIYLTTSSKNVL